MLFLDLTDERFYFAEPKEDELRQLLFAWHTANLEFANAASIKELSVRSWDQDDPHELPGAHCFLPGWRFCPSKTNLVKLRPL